MEPGTRPRVLNDTTPSRLGRFFALAVALHVPFSPLLGLLGLIRLMGAETDAPPAPPITDIPVDIIEDTDDAKGDKPGETPTATEPAAPSEPEAALPKEPEPVVVKPKKPKELPDAGAPEASDAGPDASKPDAGAATDAGAPADAGPTHKPGEGIASPVAGIGDKRVVDPNANVQLRVYTDRIRQQPLGGRIGPLLRNVYQWRDFFGPTALDPIRDIDRMLIVGSQLRDSRDVVAVLQFNIAQERVRAAIDQLVTRDPEGSWEEGPVPVARAHADRGERAFVLRTPKLVIVTPPSALEGAKKTTLKSIAAPPGDELAVATLATPWRAFLGLPVVIPKSIRSAAIRVSPRSDGGVVIDVLAHDETEPLARADAEALTTALTAATSLNLGLFGSVLFGSSQKKFIEKGSFEPDGTDIRGEIVLTSSQVETVLELAAGFLGGRAPRPRASATSPTTPTPPSQPTPPVVPAPPAAPATDPAPVADPAPGR